MKRTVNLQGIYLNLIDGFPLYSQQVVTIHKDGEVVKQSEQAMPMVGSDFSDELLEILNEKLLAYNLKLTTLEDIDG